MRHSWTISRYLLGSIVPYFLSSWLLLSVILFVQQASRFSDIFFSANIPSQLVWQLAIALIPNVIAFTCPMAVLVGTVIGLAKVQGDNELVAIRSTGAGHSQILVPVLLLGVLLSGFTFAVNIYGVPVAARAVRQVAMRTAIYKLESPIEPGVFNTEVAGYTIYVRDGDLVNGKWKDIFIHTEDQKTGTVRLITSEQGRIDSTGESSELVLDEAVSTTITASERGDNFVSERIREVRFAIQTRRGELIEKLASTESSPEELGLSELSALANSREGNERTEAEILWQRRILLGVTPIVFCVLGAALILRLGKGGRGLGLIVSLLCLITFYLIAFLGEQLARTGWLDSSLIAILPTGISVASIFLLIRLRTLGLFRWTKELFVRSAESPIWNQIGGRRRHFGEILTGVRDLDLTANLLRYFLLSLLFLTTIFLVFTGFELWRFAGSMEGGTRLLLQYLFYLLPFIYIQLAPSSAMIAILATFVIKSRQNEIVTWISAGQSVYRLLAPCFLLMLLFGAANLIVQEYIAPSANIIQEDLRQSLRSRGRTQGPVRYWVADQNRIYSFANLNIASDNKHREPSIIIYEFGAGGAELQSLYRSKGGTWSSGAIALTGPVRHSRLHNGVIENSVEPGPFLLNAENNPFKELRKRPSQLDIKATREQIRLVESDVEKRMFQVALHRKWSTLFLPFVIALFTAPFALSLNRKGKAATVGYAVGLWLGFMGFASAFEQAGASGALTAEVAVWAPLFIFAGVGLFLLMKVRT